MVNLNREDIQRRDNLNRERNQPVTIPNEATQMLNPITGLEYETDSTGSCFWKVGYKTGLSQRRFIQYFISKHKDKIYIPLEERLEKSYLDKKIEVPITAENIRIKGFEETTDYLEMQKKLAQMELRQRSESEPTAFTREDYIKFADDLVTIADEFHKSPVLTLKLIADAAGLNLALRGVENRRDTIGKINIFGTLGRTTNYLDSIDEDYFEKKLFKIRDKKGFY